MNKMEFCFVVFSHAGTDEKEEILHESLKSIKGFGYPIILASHLPVSRKNQDLVDYFIKDRDNLIVDESDIINPNPGAEISQDLYYVHDCFGGKTFSTNTFKQTYQSGVFNLYINSVNLVKSLGFKNIILWEFDFLLGKIAAENFSKILVDYSENGQRFFSFGSYIQELNCMQAIPSILNVEMLSSFFPATPIKDPKSFAGISNLMIMEQWVRDRVNKSGQNGRNIDYTYMNDYLPDSSKGQVHSQLGSYMFFNLRSGIYFSKSDENMIYYTSNSSKIKLKSILEITKPSDSKILYVKEHHADPNNWAYDFLPNDVVLQSLTEEGINVTERIEEIESGKIKDFAYSINKNNRDYVSRLRKYS